jgi:hypothetical protein
MRKQLATLTAGVLLLLSPAAAQDDDALSQWGKVTGDALVHFLPNAAPWGLSPDPSPIFNAFANDSPHKYISLVVHQLWWFDDAELSRQMADLQKEKAALNQEEEESLKEFQRVHGAEMAALRKAYQAEIETLSREGADLAKQGKYAEAGAVMQKIKPFHYEPFDSLTASLDKRQQQIAERERQLTSRRRNVSFRIYTNRTPSTTAFAYPAKPIGTLAGRVLYRQSYTLGTTDNAYSNLAIFLGPPGYQNPPAKIGQRELAVKCIVVWAWIQSRPDIILADEATARKVLQSMDYDGLSKLIEP